MNAAQMRLLLWVLLAFSLVIAGMGLAFLLFPPRPLPTDPAAYERITRELIRFTNHSSGKRAQAGGMAPGDRITFSVAGDARVFVTQAAPGVGAESWMAGKTVLDFHAERNAPQAGTPDDPVPALAVVAQGRPGPGLMNDIAHHNRPDSTLGGKLALMVGAIGATLCLTVLFLRRTGAPPA